MKKEKIDVLMEVFKLTGLNVTLEEIRQRYKTKLRYLVNEDIERFRKYCRNNWISNDS